jgi:alpha-ketoglutarate-dependent 2,4-dichlorophenoxyacetate dioxygenase
MPMDIIPLGPGFAVELRGVKIAEIASDGAAYSAVRGAFEEHSILVFRGQEVDDESQLTFSRCFGPPEVTKVGSQGTGTHFVILSTIACRPITDLRCAIRLISSGTQIARLKKYQL